MDLRSLITVEER